MQMTQINNYARKVKDIAKNKSNSFNDSTY